VDIRKSYLIDAPRDAVWKALGGDWPKPSIATFKLADEDGKTRVDLIHTDVPDDEAADFDAGWDDFYLGAIKEWLEGRG
jgi:hypothetical protein